MEIAKELDICSTTVEYHVSNILGKPEAVNRTESAVAGLALGLLGPVGHDAFRRPGDGEDQGLT